MTRQEVTSPPTQSRKLWPNFLGAQLQVVQRTVLRQIAMWPQIRHQSLMTKSRARIAVS